MPLVAGFFSFLVPPAEGFLSAAEVLAIARFPVFFVGFELTKATGKNNLGFSHFFGFSWIFMCFHVSSWVFMGFHGSSWVFMGLHVSSCVFLLFF